MQFPGRRKLRDCHKSLLSHVLGLVACQLFPQPPLKLLVPFTVRAVSRPAEKVELDELFEQIGCFVELPLPGDV
jgi:hypothetical protein